MKKITRLNHPLTITHMVWITLIGSLLTACSTNQRVKESADNPLTSVNKTQTTKNTTLETPRLAVRDGIIYMRRQSSDQLIEMVLNANNPELDLEIALKPFETELDDLPSTTESENGEFANAYFINAQGYFLNREYKRALVEINRSVRENPKSSISWALKGSIHYRRNENGLARQAWQRALKIDPDATRVKEMLDIIGQ